MVGLFMTFMAGPGKRSVISYVTAAPASAHKRHCVPTHLLLRGSMGLPGSSLSYRWCRELVCRRLPVLATVHQVRPSMMRGFSLAPSSPKSVRYVTVALAITRSPWGPATTSECL